MMEKHKKGESGMMVVEAVLSFTVFIMAVSAIVYLITIFTLHNKVQFAINSTAHELAAYTYLYQALGIRDADRAVKRDGEKYVSAIDDTADQIADTLNKIETLSGDLSGTTELSPEHIKQTIGDLKAAGESGKESAKKVKDLVSNPNDLIVGFIYMAFDIVDAKVKNIFANAAAATMAKKYLVQGDKDADAYLTGMGVEGGYAGLDFSSSTVFCDEGYRLIDIVVEYDVDLSFVRLLIPEAKLHIVQRATVAGWLGGDQGDKAIGNYKGVEKKW